MAGEVHQRLSVENVKLLTAINLEEVKTAFDNGPISMVIMGAGIELEARLGIFRDAFQASTSTTVHMKDVYTGPEGFAPFVKSILHYLKDSALVAVRASTTITLPPSPNFK